MSEKICQICGKPLKCKWIDKYQNGSTGMAACLICGTPYQLKDGTTEQCIAGEYPYIGLKEEWIPIVYEYWRKKGISPFSGSSLFGGTISTEDFISWIKQNHPKMRFDSND
jgi:hypothetical protein